MKIWTVANQKGGVGKTTTAVSLAGILALQGKRVLLIDTDPHASLTYYFGIDSEGIDNILLKKDRGLTYCYRQTLGWHNVTERQ